MPAEPVAAAGAGRKPGFRADIQGLRAIAVLLVVLYHSGVAVLSGGYVGVDVFFVISGFLITTHLLESLGSTGRIRFGSFYAKRARRILPAALLVAALTVIASWIWLSPLLMDEVVDGAIATALYIPNILFAREETDYLAGTTPSMFQHYWSLGIEEQFYLFWPALLALVFWLCRRSERRSMIVTAVLMAGSFVLCLVVMNSSQPWAFFSLPTRAWELGAGGLLAFLLRSGATWTRSARTGWLTWGGLALLLFVAFAYDENTPFPGWTAALPVLATVLMILGGASSHSSRVTRALGVRPLQFIGAISYSLYLVHWPLLMIPDAARAGDEPLPLAIRLLLGAAAFPLAWLLHRFVEKPVIASRPLRERTQLWTAGLAITSSVGVILLSGAVHHDSSRQVLATDREVAPTQLSTAPQGTPFVPTNLDPTLETAADDNAAVYDNGCHRSETEDDPGGCRIGSNPEAPLVFLFGDSHAASWYPALEQLAQEGRIRLDANTKSSCYSFEVEQSLEGVPYTSCDRWRDGVIDRIDQEQPDLVLLANFHNEDTVLADPSEDLEQAWERGASSTIARLSGTEVAVLKDVPAQDGSPELCLSQNLESTAACDVSRADAFATGLADAEAAAVDGSDAHHWDFTPYFCNDETCPTIIGNTMVYRDGHHFTATFGRQLSAPLRESIESALE